MNQYTIKSIQLPNYQSKPNDVKIITQLEFKHCPRFDRANFQKREKLHARQLPNNCLKIRSSFLFPSTGNLILCHARSNLNSFTHKARSVFIEVSEAELVFWQGQARLRVPPRSCRVMQELVSPTKHATFLFPLFRIGEQTAPFVGHYAYIRHRDFLDIIVDCAADINAR